MRQPTTCPDVQRRFRTPLLLLVAAAIVGCAPPQTQGASRQEQSTLNTELAAQRSWLAGDHHIHSRFSTRYDDSTDPPTPILGGDSPYSIPTNAEMARGYGLSWMVATDHGGPNHSKVNLEQAYPELLQSRREVGDVIQFFGLELNTPAGEHNSLIVPHSDHEHHVLYDLESRFDRRDAYPADPTRDTEARMLEALSYMRGIEIPPVVIVHHPSRTATDLSVYGSVSPHEIRAWNDTAPEVAVGMEGAPGHQAAGLQRDGSLDPEGARGGYGRHPTYGGFDQMTARVGGFWDSLLGEGRRWWITSNSDSHRHYTEGGSDFWPGEYSKTYVYAEKDYDDILDGLRHGRVFVTTGDLVTQLDVTARAAGTEAAAIGGTLALAGAADVEITIRLRDPEAPNHGGGRPEVGFVDLIVGEITGPLTDRSADTNPTTRVAKRFTAADWTRDGEYRTMSYTLEDVHHSSYLRVRGTNNEPGEPAADPRGEDPWADLWFYSNPIFLEVH